MKKNKRDEPRIVVASSDDVEQYTGSKAPAEENAVSQSSAPMGETDQPEALLEDGQDWKARFLRAKADFQNLQRRSQQEQRNAVQFANADFARAMLDVIDDLERTLQASRDSQDQALVSGVQLVYEKMLKVLKDQQVQGITALGEPFDPRLHEALMQQSSTEHSPNTVIEEVRKGYKLHERVIRPARVVVSGPPPEDGL